MSGDRHCVVHGFLRCDCFETRKQWATIATDKYNAEVQKASPLSFAKERAAYETLIADLERQLANEKAECAALIHDIERHIAIASGEADARAKAEARCAKMRKTLEWFSDPRNYEDTEQYVAYLRANIVWSTGISVALAALAEGGEHG